MLLIIFFAFRLNVQALEIDKSIQNERYEFRRRLALQEAEEQMRLTRKTASPTVVVAKPQTGYYWSLDDQVHAAPPAFEYRSMHPNEHSYPSPAKRSSLNNSAIVLHVAQGERLQKIDPPGFFMTSTQPESTTSIKAVDPPSFERSPSSTLPTVTTTPSTPEEPTPTLPVRFLPPVLTRPLTMPTSRPFLPLPPTTTPIRTIEEELFGRRLNSTLIPGPHTYDDIPEREKSFDVQYYDDGIFNSVYIKNVTISGRFLDDVNATNGTDETMVGDHPMAITQPLPTAQRNASVVPAVGGAPENRSVAAKATASPVVPAASTVIPTPGPFVSTTATNSSQLAPTVPGPTSNQSAPLPLTAAPAVGAYGSTTTTLVPPVFTTATIQVYAQFITPAIPLYPPSGPGNLIVGSYNNDASPGSYQPAIPPPQQSYGPPPVVTPPQQSYGPPPAVTPAGLYGISQSPAGYQTYIPSNVAANPQVPGPYLPSTRTELAYLARVSSIFPTGSTTDYYSGNQATRSGGYGGNTAVTPQVSYGFYAGSTRSGYGGGSQPASPAVQTYAVPPPAQGYGGASPPSFPPPGGAPSYGSPSQPSGSPTYGSPALQPAAGPYQPYPPTGIQQNYSPSPSGGYGSGGSSLPALPPSFYPQAGAPSPSSYAGNPGFAGTTTIGYGAGKPQPLPPGDVGFNVPISAYGPSQPSAYPAPQQGGSYGSGPARPPPDYSSNPAYSSQPAPPPYAVNNFAPQPQTPAAYGAGQSNSYSGSSSPVGPSVVAVGYATGTGTASMSFYDASHVGAASAGVPSNPASSYAGGATNQGYPSPNLGQSYASPIAPPTSVPVPAYAGNSVQNVPSSGGGSNFYGGGAPIQSNYGQPSFTIQPPSIQPPPSYTGSSYGGGSGSGYGGGTTSSGSLSNLGNCFIRYPDSIITGVSHIQRLQNINIEDCLTACLGGGGSSTSSSYGSGAPAQAYSSPSQQSSGSYGGRSLPSAPSYGAPSQPSYSSFAGSQPQQPAYGGQAQPQQPAYGGQAQPQQPAYGGQVQPPSSSPYGSQSSSYGGGQPSYGTQTQQGSSSYGAPQPAYGGQSPSRAPSVGQNSNIFILSGNYAPPSSSAYGATGNAGGYSGGTTGVCQASVYVPRYQSCDLFDKTGHNPPARMLMLDGYDYYETTGRPGCSGGGAQPSAYGPNSPAAPPAGLAAVFEDGESTEDGLAIQRPVFFNESSIRSCSEGSVPIFQKGPNLEVININGAMRKAMSEADCLEACRLNKSPDASTFNCLSANYDVNTETCFLSSNAAAPTGSGNLVPKIGSTYFEKTCLPANYSQKCGSKTFERAPQVVSVNSGQEIQMAHSIGECIELCLNAPILFDFKCLSVAYFYEEKMINCLLNSESRQTKRSEFISEADNRVEYIGIDECAMKSFSPPADKTNTTIERVGDLIKPKRITQPSALFGSLLRSLPKVFHFATVPLGALTTPSTDDDDEEETTKPTRLPAATTVTNELLTSATVDPLYPRLTAQWLEWSVCDLTFVGIVGRRVRYRDCAAPILSSCPFETQWCGMTSTTTAQPEQQTATRTLVDIKLSEKVDDTSLPTKLIFTPGFVQALRFVGEPVEKPSSSREVDDAPEDYKLPPCKSYKGNCQLGIRSYKTGVKRFCIRPDDPQCNFVHKR